LCSHSKHQKNLFQSKQSKHVHQSKNSVHWCETGSNKVKLPKVGSNVMIDPTKSKELSVLVISETLKNWQFPWKNPQWRGSFMASYLIFQNNGFIYQNWILDSFWETLVMNPQTHPDNHLVLFSNNHPTLFITHNQEDFYLLVTMINQFLHNNGTKISNQLQLEEELVRASFPKTRELSSPDLTIILSLIVEDIHMNTIIAWQLQH
jgi:hypothetical protein